MLADRWVSRDEDRLRGTALRIVVTALLLTIAVTVPLPVRAAVVALVVADFDYSDTSGEPVDQTAEHRSRVAEFDNVLRSGLGAQHGYRVLRLECPHMPCSAGAMPPADFIAAAQRAGARYVVYGGIRKMSTLVQWGEVQLLDLDSSALLLRRTVTFRGDTDMAFRRAAEFVGETVRDALPKP